jgi:hypothetical protein
MGEQAGILVGGRQQSIALYLSRHAANYYRHDVGANARRERVVSVSAYSVEGIYEMLVKRPVRTSRSRAAEISVEARSIAPANNTGPRSEMS